MSTKHQDSIRQYVNDMIGLETDISKAIRGQLDDDRVTRRPVLTALLDGIATASERRIETLKSISKSEGGALGAALKESVTTATGVLAGLYGKVREHSVSRMVRDDIVAQTTAATAYGMLLTLALSAGHSELQAIAQEGLKGCAPTVTLLTRELPQVVGEELAEDEPSANPAAVQASLAAIREAWREAPST
ncbi:hypothetical protein OJ996_19755 [Luteolibacter sp. GHJ8]|uniref:DUF892 family protein n=1 Tax=Luteolibacter rhizosphaerae TaxID=2989719 RepID=A0ABT3G7K1_9BACT|nr:hypothetical protein [Luteolibacter rhizosphaerae]MCW1915832.1 hypothetical protein [Luteolibacter rhizosphaerae]